MTSSILPLKRRIVLVASLWIAGLILGSIMFLIVDPQDRAYYLLAVANFPVGLLAAFSFENGLPRYLVWGLWALYLLDSGWLLSVKARRVFWWGFGVLGVIVVCNIGGCAYILRH